MKISVVVPTYNRSEKLPLALNSMLEQDMDPSTYEILVIDNNSTDDTKQAAHQAMSSAACKWRYIMEPKQGVHHARNRGILAAQGEVVIIGDDDIIAEPQWLSSIAAEFAEHPATGIVGGKVLPIWSAEPEAWIYDYGTPQVHPLFAILDYGDERFPVEDAYVFANNFAIRREVALEIGGSYPCTFPSRLKHLSGTGENAMIDNTRALGYDVVYLPNAIVHHHADASRITLEYFIDRHERWAIEEVFDAFRHRSREEAVRYVTALACERFEQWILDSESKQRPEYYRIIGKQWAAQVFTQMSRILTEPSLYDHIMQKNYLMDLQG